MRPIDMFIVGAQKAGTTALKNYLSEHPSIESHPHVEMTYFSDAKEYAKGYESAFNKYFDWKKTEKDQRVIAKNVTISFREECLKRLYDSQPDTQLVFIIREPVSRAYSAYQMAVRGGWMEQPFSYAKEAIASREVSKSDQFYRFILDLGMYYCQLQTLLKYYKRENIHVVIYEEMKDNAISICQNLFRVLSIDDSFVPNTNKKHNSGGSDRSKALGKMIKSLRQEGNLIKQLAKRFLPEKQFVELTKKVYSLNRTENNQQVLDIELKNILREFYRPHNELCSELIGRDLNTIWRYS